MGGMPYDQMEGGFFIWDEKTITDAPRYTLKENAFQVNGRATFMPGADMHHDHVTRPLDTPLLWYRDAKKMRDFGLLQYQTLSGWMPWTSPDNEREAKRKTVSPRLTGWRWPTGWRGFNICPRSSSPATWT